jgi:hypothetical protein
MSRLYEILRQVEEKSRSVNLSPQELVILDASVKHSEKKWWESYRIVVVIVVITLLATAGIVLAPRLLTHPTEKQTAFSLSSKPGTSPAANVSATPQYATTVEKHENPPSIGKATESSRGGGEQPQQKPSIVTVEGEKLSKSEGSPDAAKVFGQNVSLEKSSQLSENAAHDSAVPVHGSAQEEIKISPDKPKVSRKAASKKAKWRAEKSESVSAGTTSRALQAVLPVQSGMIIMAEEARKRGNIEEAIRLYKQHTALYKDPFAMNNLGALLITRGNLKEAEHVLQEAFSILPDEDIALNLMGVEIMLGKRSQACQIFNRIREVNPHPTVPPAFEQTLSDCTSNHQ